MSVDWTKVGQKATQHHQKHEDGKSSFIVTVGNAGGRIYDSNPNDARLDGMHYMAGTKPVDKERLLEALRAIGVTDVTFASADEAQGPPALEPASGHRHLQDFWRVYESDGKTFSTDIEWVLKTNLEEIARYGLVPQNDPATGLQIGLRKRSSSATPAPAAPAPADREVPLQDKDGKAIPGRRVKVSEVNDNPDYKPVVDGSGQTIAFREVPKWLIGRRH